MVQTIIFDVDGVFASYQVGYKKSQSEFWQYVYAALSPIKKDEILLIDDEEENIQAAKDFGFCAALYTDFHSFAKNLKTFV